MKKNKQKNKKNIICLVVLLLTVCLTVGFSAFQNELFISDMLLKVRLQRDVRVSNSVISKTSGSVVNSEEYNKTKLLGNVTFDSTSSYVLYKVDLTNYGNVKSGLLNINSNTGGINYSICDSNGSNCTNNLETAICNGSNCTLGATKEVYVKVSSTTSGTKNIDLDLDIQPYVNITYDNIRENTSSFKTEVLETSTYQITLTSKPEEVEVSGDVTASYNKNTGVLVLSNIQSDLTIQAKYLLTEVAHTSYTEAAPENYVRFNNVLYRIITKENIDDGYGNSEFRAKITSDSSIGNNVFDDESNEYGLSSLKDELNTTYYNSLNSISKELIDTAKWTNESVENIGLINTTDYNNSSWLRNDQYTLTKAENNKVVAVSSTGLIDSEISVSRSTFPTIYLKTNVLVVGGNGTESNPYILDLASNGLQPNPTVISRKNLTVTGSNQELVTVSNKVGTPYYSVGTQLNSSNYSSGSTTIPSRSNAGSYTIYYYIPAEGVYKAKSGSVTSTINGLTFTIAYQKGSNVSAIGKTSDSCTTSGSSLSCSVTLPSITPGTGYENGKWSDGTNTYNPGASYTLSSNGKSLTATVSGKTYVATFNKNGADSIGSSSISCTVTTGSNCSVTAPSITRSGYTIVGWNTSASAQTGTAVNSSITLTGNATYNAITKKNITITFNKNGNTSQTVSGGTASTNNTVTQTCAMWNTASNCSITSPTITPASGFTVIGYSEGETNRTNAWTQNTSKNVNSDKTYFAQSSKAGVTRTITFYKNNAKSFTYSGTKYTDTSKTFDACNIPTVYNGATQSSSCTATINMPTIEVDTGYTENGWGTSASATTPTYTSGQTNASVAMNSNKQFYALRTTNSLTFANQSITKTFSTSSQTATVTAASNGTGTYTYEEKSEKNSGGTNTNYISLSGTTITIAANTPANTYTYVITATDTNSGATKDATYTITINQKKATLGVASSASLTYKTAQTLDYTYDGDGTVSCQSADTSYVTCSVNQSTKKLTITPVKVTSSAITVTLKAGNGTNYSAADNKTVSVTVAKFTPTVSLSAKTGMTWNNNPQPANTATVTLTNGETYSGPIVYTYYTNNACNAGATTTAPTLANNYWVRASIAAQTNYNAASSGCINHSIATANTTLTLVAKTEAQRTYTGSPIVANTATVSPNGGGAITYKYYTNSACSAGETETAPTNVGTYYAKASVSAVSGKTNAASSACVNHSIVQKKATLGLTQTSLGLTYKTAQTLDYTYDGDGTVSCQSADTSYVTCSVNTSTKKLTITPVKATSSAITVTLKAGNGTNYSAADNKTVSVTVAKFTPTVSLTAKSAAQRTYTGSPIVANTATVTLTNSETYSGTINYKYYTNNGCTSGETSTAPTYGNYWAQASITAQGNYNAAKSACVNHNIVAATPTVTLTAKSEAQRTYTGSPIVANTATVSPNGGGTITYKYYTNSACSAGETETAPTNVGTYYAKASVSAVSGKTNAASSGCVNHSIVRASSSLSISPTSGTLTYGTNGTSTITKTGDGTLSCSSSDETVAKCSISGTTLTIIPQAVGADNKTATITVSLSQGNNYNAASNVTYSATVNRKKTTVTGTFHYNSNTTSGSFTNATKTSNCTYYNAATSCTLTVPTEVSNSVGKYNSAYKGISRTTGNMTVGSLTVSANQTFYAFYSSPITIYYPNTSNAIASNNTALYRNEYYSSATAMNTLTATSQTSTTQATTITLSSIKGTFQGINSAVNSTTRYGVNDSTNVINKDTKTFYAVTTASENAIIHYNSNTTNGSFTDATANAGTTITYYCTSTSAMGTSHGTTTTVPSAVSGSVGKYNSAYKGISSSSTGITNVTTFTGGQTYYAYYSSPVTIYYPSSTTARGSYSYYRNEYYNSATSMNSVINSSQTSTTNFTFSSSVTDYILYGFANSAGTNTKNYDNIAALANSDKTSNYAILYKSVPVTFYYNSDTSSGTFAGSNAMANANQYLRCTSTASELSNSNITIPQIVSGSVGKYNSAYKGVHTSLSNMGSVTPTTANTTYYANYSSPVTNYYYGTSYTNRTLYRNEFLTTADAIASRLATSNTSTSNYSTATGPGSSVWSGLSEAADTIAEYSTIQQAADSSSNALYTIYQFNITYQKGSNISSIGATSGNCKVTTSSTACNVVLPSITPVAGYNSVGWNTSSGATSGTSAGSNYSLNTNGRTLYANASIMYKCPASKTENITWGSEAASAYGNYTNRCQTSWHSSLGTFQDLNNHSVCGSNRICTTYDAGGGMYCCNDCTCRMFDFDGCVEDKSCTVYTCPTNITYTINWGEPSLTKYGDYQSECVAYSNVTMYQCPTSGTLIYGNYGGKQTAKYGSYQAQCTSSTEQNSLCGVSSSETYDTCNWTPRCPEEGNCYDVLDANGNREMTCCKCTRVNYKSCTLYNCPTTVTTGAPWTYGSWQTAKYGSYQSACISNQ